MHHLQTWSMARRRLGRCGREGFTGILRLLLGVMCGVRSKDTGVESIASLSWDLRIFTVPPKRPGRARGQSAPAGRAQGGRSPPPGAAPSGTAGGGGGGRAGCTRRPRSSLPPGERPALLPRPARAGRRGVLEPFTDLALERAVRPPELRPREHRPVEVAEDLRDPQVVAVGNGRFPHINRLLSSLS